MRRLLSAARKGRVPVIWTAVKFTHPDMLDAGIFYLKHPHLSIWQAGDKRGYDQWMPGLEPEPEDLVIYKQYPSPFFGTTLATSLRHMGVDTLVLCGVSTSGCVRAAVGHEQITSKTILKLSLILLDIGCNVPWLQTNGEQGWSRVPG